MNELLKLNAGNFDDSTSCVKGS